MLLSYLTPQIYTPESNKFIVYALKDNTKSFCQFNTNCLDYCGNIHLRDFFSFLLHKTMFLVNNYLPLKSTAFGRVTCVPSMILPF